MVSGNPSATATAACTPCRTVKMKCTRDPDSASCNRCKRKSLSCFYESHRRGRKPGTKLRPKAERLKAAGLPALLSSAPPQDSSPAVTPEGIVGSSIDTRSPKRIKSDTSFSSPDLPDKPIQPAITSDNPLPTKLASIAQLTHPLSDSLAPFALLKKSSTPGNFSIANILNAENESQAEEPSHWKDCLADDAPIDQNDPVLQNLINLPIAQGLFDSFFKYMNPFICQFDPVLHTVRYVRNRSPFLFTALLTVAAKVFCPALYVKLREHSEKLLHNIMGSGEKSLEVIQGVCLLTHWKESNDTRAWMFIGYAIRGALELGLNKLKPSILDKPMQLVSGFEEEMELREQRSKERTWLVLFIYDRSLSLQLGMPSMISMDPLIRNVQNWHQHAYATPGIDEMVTALTQLRIIGFELLDLFWLDPLHTSPDFMKKDEFILRLCNDELDRWEARWHLVIDEADATLTQRFLVRFYGHHLRLLLHSFQLQLSIANGSASKPALWVCYASSLEMVRLIIDRLGTTSYLYYCQDSIHVMVAYAAVAIVKILLSFPGELPGEAENKVLDYILEASEYFSRQSPTDNTSCHYQGQFLANVVSQYRTSRDLPASSVKRPASKELCDLMQQTTSGADAKTQVNLSPIAVPPLHQTPLPSPFQPHHHQQQHQQDGVSQPQQSQQQHLTPLNHHLQVTSHLQNDLFSSSNTPPPIPMHMPLNDPLHNPHHDQQTLPLIHPDHNQQLLACARPLLPPSNIECTISGSINSGIMSSGRIFASPSLHPSSTHQANNNNTSTMMGSGGTAPASGIPVTSSSGPAGNAPNNSDSNDGYDNYTPTNAQNVTPFSNTGTWENLFAHAGFNINGGAFLPNPGSS
ncbi:priB protein [Nannizzia gypsea CBS 118893]|uniref:PriB protein n=1 Tax=Arthroderma gypseum (strain ATCC MYA-4604 / CBS 118893) TaxID=535722 RepID=E4UMQ3_ARTGP|nr:priB protein [Nannizzia gypsea CBS 118893]EFQ99470.1 priB protein [Nannizzia gypsea CBS 118893]